MDVSRLTPGDLIPLMKAAGVDFVLVGAHGIGGWLKQSRATEDVDLLIRVRDKRKASGKILERFPELTLEDCAEVIRFKRNEDGLVDLMLTSSPLYKRVFVEFHEINVDGFKVKVPKLEAALAMKFAAMTGHYRDPDKKHYDAGDFGSMVRKNVNIDEVLLREMVELKYLGAGDEVMRYVEDIRAGRSLRI